MLIELAVIAVLVTAIVLAFSIKKKLVEQPIIIQKAGNYHLTLSPQLQSQQDFLQQLLSAIPPCGDTPALYFLCKDYLVAICSRNNIVYCQAIPSVPNVAQYDTIHSFAEAVMVLLPLSVPVNEQHSQTLLASITTYTQQAAIPLVAITERRYD